MENLFDNKNFKSRFNNAREITNGLRSEGIMVLKPLEKGPPEHIHLLQTEFFEVIEGELIVKENGQDYTLKSGNRKEIIKGQKHTYFNATTENVTVKFGYEPALNIQFMLDIMEKGEAKNGGNWNKFPILETGYLLYNLRKEYRLANIPFWFQNIVFGILSTIAKLTGVSKKIELPE
jgi:Cupin domain